MEEYLRIYCWVSFYKSLIAGWIIWAHFFSCHAATRRVLLKHMLSERQLKTDRNSKTIHARQCFWLKQTNNILSSQNNCEWRLMLTTFCYNNRTQQSNYRIIHRFASLLTYHPQSRQCLCQLQCCTPTPRARSSRQVLHLGRKKCAEHRPKTNVCCINSCRVFCLGRLTTRRSSGSTS